MAQIGPCAGISQLAFRQSGGRTIGQSAKVELIRICLLVSTARSHDRGALAHSRRGVASGLVAQLAERARRAGVRRFTGYMLGENLAARRLLEGLGATATRGASPELVEFELQLDEPARAA